MMVKTNFTDPNPSITQLKAERDRLKYQANVMLKSTSILDIYSKYLKLNGIGGSYSYNLMVYPDLDLDISPDPRINKLQISNLVADLSKSKYVKSLTLNDLVNFNSNNSDWSGGYFIGAVVEFENEDWGIDCWVQKEGNLFFDYKEHEKWLCDISNEEADAILLIKYKLLYKKLYGSKFSSYQLYDAVLNKRVRTAEDFLAIYE